MPCAGMDAAKFLLCWLHESLCCILCSLICVLASKIIYLFSRWRGKCAVPRVSEPSLETPVPKRCSAVGGEAGKGLGRAGGWVGVNTHVRSERLEASASWQGLCCWLDSEAAPYFKMILKWVWGSSCLQLSAHQQPDADPVPGRRDHLPTATVLEGTSKIDVPNWALWGEERVNQPHGWSEALVSFIISACAQPQHGGCARGIRASVGAGDTESMNKNTPQSAKKPRILLSGRAHRS